MVSAGDAFAIADTIFFASRFRTPFLAMAKPKQAPALLIWLNEKVDFEKQYYLLYTLNLLVLYTKFVCVRAHML